MKYDLERKKWDISNHKCLMVAKSTNSDAIRGSIPDCDTVTEYLKKVESQFTGSSKAYASTLIEKNCPDFLKHLMRKGVDIITFVDESLY